jgi:hypothetical protein
LTPLFLYPAWRHLTPLFLDPGFLALIHVVTQIPEAHLVLEKFINQIKLNA